MFKIKKHWLGCSEKYLTHLKNRSQRRIWKRVCLPLHVTQAICNTRGERISLLRPRELFNYLFFIHDFLQVTLDRNQTKLRARSLFWKNEFEESSREAETGISRTHHFHVASDLELEPNLPICTPACTSCLSKKRSLHAGLGYASSLKAADKHMAPAKPNMTHQPAFKRTSQQAWPQPPHHYTSHHSALRILPQKEDQCCAINRAECWGSLSKGKKTVEESMD